MQTYRSETCGYYPSPMHRGELRLLGTLRLPMLSGCIAAYDNYYFHDGTWNTIRRGAFGSLLSSHPEIDIRINHSEFVVPGTVTLSDANNGLFGKFELEDSRLGRMLISSLQAGYLTWLSFNFSNAKVDWGKFRGEPSREITSVDCMPEVSFVSQPAQIITGAKIDGEYTPSEPRRIGAYGMSRDDWRLQGFLYDCGHFDQPWIEPRPHPVQAKLSPTVSTPGRLNTANVRQLIKEFKTDFLGDNEGSRVVTGCGLFD